MRCSARAAGEPSIFPAVLFVICFGAYTTVLLKTLILTARLRFSVLAHPRPVIIVVSSPEEMRINIILRWL